MRIPASFALGLLTLSSACVGSDPLVFTDGFGPPDSSGDALHIYAANAKLVLTLESSNADVDPAKLSAEADGALSLDAEEDGAGPELVLRTGDAGEGTVVVKNADGAVVSERTLTVVDVEEIALAVTAPATPGLTLPTVDLAGTRIFRGGKAAFRTTLTAGGDEVMGLEAVTATPTDTTVGVRSGVGAAADSRVFQRNAVELDVPGTAVDPFDVAFTAGSGAVTLHVVPTPVGDLDEAVLEDQATAGAKDGDDLWVVAHVLAGTEPVFGVPIQWTYGDAVLVNEDDEQPLIGDVLQYKLETAATVDIVAQFAALRVTGRVPGAATGAAVGSITAACGAGSAPLVVALAALLARRSRRR